MAMESLGVRLGINSAWCKLRGDRNGLFGAFNFVFILRPISAVPASAITQQLISLANDNPV